MGYNIQILHFKALRSLVQPVLYGVNIVSVLQKRVLLVSDKFIIAPREILYRSVLLQISSYCSISQEFLSVQQSP